MKHLSRSVVINAPARNVYNQWTQFEEFPRFIPWHGKIRQIDSMRVMWCLRIWGRRLKWRTDIYEQVPDRYIAWRSPPGTAHHGSVTFDAIDGDTTRVTLTVAYQPHGFVGWIWTALGATEWHMTSALKRFRKFIESRSYATGGWRGRIHEGVVLWQRTPGPPVQVRQRA